MNMAKKKTDSSNDAHKIVKTKFDELQNMYGEIFNEVTRIKKDLTIKMEEKNNLNQEISNLKISYKTMKNEAYIVSLYEFKIVQKSIQTLSLNLSELNGTIKELSKSLSLAGQNLKICTKELEKYQKELETFGTIHDFKKK